MNALLWYNERPMLRRTLAFALLAILLLPLAGGIVEASVCLEPCPEDSADEDCTPLCAACTSCTHSQVAGILRGSATDAPSAVVERAAPVTGAGTQSPLVTDIFHVPLSG